MKQLDIEHWWHLMRRCTCYSSRYHCRIEGIMALFFSFNLVLHCNAYSKVQGKILASTKLHVLCIAVSLVQMLLHLEIFAILCSNAVTDIYL